MERRLLLGLLLCAQAAPFVVENFFDLENFTGAKEKEYLQVKNILDPRFVLVTWNQFFDGEDSVWSLETREEGDLFIIDNKRSIIKHINRGGGLTSPDGHHYFGHFLHAWAAERLHEHGAVQPPHLDQVLRNRRGQVGSPGSACTSGAATCSSPAKPVASATWRVSSGPSPRASRPTARASPQTFRCLLSTLTGRTWLPSGPRLGSAF